MTLPILRRYAPEAFVRHVWWAARDPDTPLGQPCPSCRRSAREVPGSTPVLLDVCPRCQLVWFDAAEFDTVPRRVEKPIGDVRSPEAAEALARFEIEHANRMARYREGRPPREGPGEIWKYVPALLGFPVELDEASYGSRPWATWGLVALIALVGVLTIGHIDAIARSWGLIPSRPLLHGGLNVVTSFFLHAGWMHLLGNLYFLWIFGDDVEALIGPGRFLIVVAVSAFVGDVLHVMLASMDLPTIGSSGGISGVLAFYVLAQPRARLALLFGWVFWIRVPAWGYLALWVLLQVLGAASGGGGVAYTAHLGGALGGLLLWFLWRDGLLGARLR